MTEKRVEKWKEEPEELDLDVLAKRSSQRAKKGEFFYGTDSVKEYLEKQVVSDDDPYIQVRVPRSIVESLPAGVSRWVALQRWIVSRDISLIVDRAVKELKALIVSPEDADRLVEVEGMYAWDFKMKGQFLDLYRDVYDSVKEEAFAKDFEVYVTDMFHRRGLCKVDDLDEARAEVKELEGQIKQLEKVNGNLQKAMELQTAHYRTQYGSVPSDVDWVAYRERNGYLESRVKQLEKDVERWGRLANWRYYHKFLNLFSRFSPSEVFVRP